MTSISWRVYIPVLLAFVVGGLNQIMPMLPSTWAALAQIALSAVAVYQHGQEVQKAAGIR